MSPPSVPRQITMTPVVLLMLAALSLQRISADVLRFKPAQFDPEEQHSTFMPDHFRCDSCRAVAHQLYTTYRRYNDRHAYLKLRVPTSDLITLVETACSSKTYDEYGVKSVEGDVRLQGPGIEFPGAGVIAGGSHWPSRLSKICQQVFEDYDEDEIYALFKDNADSAPTFIDELLAANKAICKCDAKKRAKDSPLSDRPKQEL